MILFWVEKQFCFLYLKVKNFITMLTVPYVLDHFMVWLFQKSFPFVKHCINESSFILFLTIHTHFEIYILLIFYFFKIIKHQSFYINRCMAFSFFLKGISYNVFVKTKYKFNQRYQSREWKLDSDSKSDSIVVCVGLQEKQVSILNGNGDSR